MKITSVTVQQQNKQTNKKKHKHQYGIHKKERFDDEEKRLTPYGFGTLSTQKTAMLTLANY